MPGGSTKKICPFCQGILFCAQKICSNCKKEQPMKQRLKKKLQRFDEKREEWLVGRKKNHNISSIKDESIVMLEKLHAVGYKPVLLLAKETKKKEYKCEILTPRCTLSAYAQEYLQKIVLFYEYLCEGWIDGSGGNGDQLFTRHPAPGGPTGNTTTQGDDTRSMSVEQMDIVDGHAEKTSATEGRVKHVAVKEEPVEQTIIKEEYVEQMTVKEEQVEQMTMKEEQVEQMTMKEEQVEQMDMKEEQVEHMITTVGQAEETSIVEGQAFFSGSSWGDTVLDPKCKKKKSVRCSRRFAKARLENPGEMTLSS